MAEIFTEPTGIGKYNGEMIEWLCGHGYELYRYNNIPILSANGN
jgi:hypothetical protein